MDTAISLGVVALIVLGIIVWVDIETSARSSRTAIIEKLAKRLFKKKGK